MVTLTFKTHTTLHFIQAHFTFISQSLSTPSGKVSSDVSVIRFRPFFLLHPIMTQGVSLYYNNSNCNLTRKQIDAKKFSTQGDRFSTAISATTTTTTTIQSCYLQYWFSILWVNGV